MIRVAVSILNHNSAQNTIACVQSLLVAEKAACGSCHLEIFIADNASGDEDQQQLRRPLEQLASVHFQINNENLGFSAGHNRSGLCYEQRYLCICIDGQRVFSGF